MNFPRKIYLLVCTIKYWSFFNSDELDEKVNYLEVDEVSPYLKFDQDDGSFTLNGGPIDALIAYAGSTNVSGK